MYILNWLGYQAV